MDTTDKQRVGENTTNSLEDRQGGIFTNRRGQLRSGWKIVLLWVMCFAGTMVLSIIIGIPFMAVGGLAFMDNPVFNGLTDMAQVLCEIGAVLFMVYVIEKNKLRNFGMPGIRGYWRDIGYGVLFAALSMIVIFMVFTLTGNATLKNGIGHPVFKVNLLFTLLLMLLVGFGEEMMSRGYMMTVIQRQTGKLWLAVAVSSIIFACMHLLNPNVSLFGVVNLILFGVLACAMYLRTGSIWMPVAYHFTWDYFEGNVFGFPNSGMQMTSIYPFQTVKDNILTGGGFGPEGGILVTVILLLTLLWIWKGYGQTKTGVGLPS